ncbi:MAG TPA: heterodisulfide reductase-related iron-sulfur binding cluster, partial [Parachlamydiaceae bacterium]|nr:heterodisulfide reductase-related iron-sulfur binding cluster [Parachlamydiaceae bacterium]
PVQNVLDLCLECKACKTECPSHVDMAKLKAETLFQYQEKHGYSFRSRLFGFIGKINRFSSSFASLFNFLSGTKFFKFFFNLIGISKKRNLPKLAKKRFSTLFKNYPQPKGKQVLLFNDTFNEFNNPEIGISAVKVLNHLGYEVVTLPWECCGRPMISKGFLKQAKAQALKLYNQLLPFAEKNIPIIGLEPSCILAIQDDFSSLIGKEKMELIVSCCFTFDSFIAKQNLKHFKTFSAPIKIHGHCHQKSLIGMKPTFDIFKKLHIQAEEIDSGCCGMAGSFGYEKEHYDISMKIGSLKLFPAIKDNTPLIANGTSCRAQIQDGTGTFAKHLAEFLSNLI